MVNSVAIPCPTGGLNARDPLDAMSPKDAIELVNYFPEESTVRIRKGYRQHSSGMGTGDVQSLFQFSGLNGTKKLIACANGNIYDASTLGGTASSLGSGYSSNWWQGVMFTDASATAKLILVNGVDAPKAYNGTAISSPAFTGPTSINKFIQVCSFKQQLFFVEKDTSSVWYAAVNASSGATTEFPVGSFFQRGGYLSFCATYSQNTSTTGDDVFLMVSSEGEILVFEGTDPGVDFTLVRRCYIAAPMGRRAYVNTGSDIYIVTTVGVVAASTILYSANSENKYNAISDKIGNYFDQFTLSATLAEGWQAVVHEKGNIIYFNVPVGTGYQQIIMNVNTGAWSTYKGMRSACWCVYEGNIYFGGAGGRVYQADYGTNDNGNYIPTSLRTAYNYVGSKIRMKKFCMLKPLIKTNAQDLTFTAYGNVDFKESNSSDIIQYAAQSASLWDVAQWDISPWGDQDNYTSNWYSISGLGRCVSVVIKGDFKDVNYSINSFYINFVPGGVL